MQAAPKLQGSAASVARLERSLNALGFISPVQRAINQQLGVSDEMFLKYNR